MKMRIGVPTRIEPRASFPAATINSIPNPTAKLGKFSTKLVWSTTKDKSKRNPENWSKSNSTKPQPDKHAKGRQHPTTNQRPQGLDQRRELLKERHLDMVHMESTKENTIIITVIKSLSKVGPLSWTLASTSVLVSPVGGGPATTFLTPVELSTVLFGDPMNMLSNSFFLGAPAGIRRFLLPWSTLVSSVGLLLLAFLLTRFTTFATSARTIGLLSLLRAVLGPVLGRPTDGARRSSRWS